MLKFLLNTMTHSLRIQCGLQPSATRRRKKPQQCLQTDDLEPRLLLTARVWDGGGGANHDWTNRFNWQGDVAPVANDDLSFPDSATLRITHNNFPSGPTSNFRSIAFVDASYVVTGNPIQLTAGISTIGSSQQLDAGIQFVGTATHNIVVGTGDELTLNRAVTGTGTIVKQGFGRLVLAGTNTFSGQFTVHDGVVQLANSSALGSASGQTVVDDGAAIELAEFIGVGEEFPRTLQIAEPLVLAGGGIANTGALRNVSGANRWTGTIRLGDGSFAVGVGHEIIAVDAPGGEFTPDELTITGTISSNFSAGLRKIGTGRLTLSGTNTYFGETLIQEGVVQMKNSSALGSPTGPTKVSAGAGLELTNIELGGGEVIDLNVSEPLQLSGTGFGNGGALRNLKGSNTWAGSVTLLAASSVAVDLAADGLTVAGLISGGISRSLSLTKGGVGEMLLTQNNSYTGTTVVQNGILTVNGSQRFSPITVNSGVLQGIGTVGAVTMLNTGAISPGGNTIGTLTVFGDLATDGGQIRITQNATSNDRIIVNGSVKLSNSPIIVSGSATSSNRLDIIQNDLTDAVSGATNGNLVTSSSGQVFRISYTGGTGNDIQLVRQNVAPMFTNRLVTPEITEGNSVIVSGTIVEPDPRDVFFMNIDWGDGQTTHRRFAPGTPRDINLAHEYEEDGEYTIHLTWTDQSRQGNSGVLHTVVHNVAPTLEAGGTASVRMNSLFRRRLHIADPGRDSFVATVDYGDGTAPETLALGKSRNFSLNHRFTRRGAFQVSIQVVDRDGGIGTDSFFVIVT
ncbi:MAG: autotransporter-associated beta strand repeat-containing protein [Fuerstia sp.]|nr:autotransporter-associated beta strand repeat-containing protein [Fuerstiella sp.]